jgi:hypothetical protein
MSFNQYRTNPSQAVGSFKGRSETPKAWPSNAVSKWTNGGLFGAAASQYEKLAHANGSGGTTILFTGIPQNHKNLIIVGNVFNTWTGGAHQWDMWWNQGSSTPSSGSDYKRHSNYNYNTNYSYSASAAGGVTKFEKVGYTAYNSGNVAYGDAAGFEMVIPRYSSSGHDKGFVCQFAALSYGEGNQNYWGYSGGNKHNTAPITEICFYSGMNFSTATNITIYGLIEAS